MKDGTSSLKTGADKLDSGAGTLKTGIDRTYTKGTDQLNSGIQTYLSKKGVLSGKTGEFKKGVDTLAQGIEQYTDGASTLNDGVSAYVDGVNKLSAGASQLQPLVEGLTTVKGAIQQMNAALDGKGDVTEDINAAAQALAAGTRQTRIRWMRLTWKQSRSRSKTLTAYREKSDYRSRYRCLEVFTEADQLAHDAGSSDAVGSGTFRPHLECSARHRFRSWQMRRPSINCRKSRKQIVAECRFG